MNDICHEHTDDETRTVAYHRWWPHPIDPRIEVCRECGDERIVKEW